MLGQHTGEIGDRIKRIDRDDNGVVTAAKRVGVAARNLEKLRLRREHGTIIGTGAR
jgi:hypothetical protein